MMNEPRHILICGDRGVGKSTLIQKLLARNTLPVYGFLTERLAADETGFHPIYIHPAGTGRRRHEERNQIGACDSRRHNVSIEAFNTLGARYLFAARPGGIIVMDELGFMEARAETFVNAVFAALNGDIPVIAAVKARYDVAFLNEVRAHPNASVSTITKEARDALYHELLPVMLQWNAGSGRQASDIKGCD